MAQVVQKPSVRSPGAPSRPRWPCASAWGIALTAANHRPCSNPGGRWAIFGWNLRMARSRALVFVSLKWSHGFLSMNFVILGKFWFIKYFFEEKKRIFSKWKKIVEKLFRKKNSFFLEILEISKIFKILRLSKISKFRKFWNFLKSRRQNQNIPWLKS